MTRSSKQHGMVYVEHMLEQIRNLPSPVNDVKTYDHSFSDGGHLGPMILKGAHLFLMAGSMGYLTTTCFMLCCNKVKLSPWTVSMIHANAP